jgi:hypothetical protein
LLSSASATLPRATAPGGRLCGVVFSDAGDGRRADVHTVRDPVAFSDTGALAILVRVGEPVGEGVGESLDLTFAFTNRRDGRGERRAEPDAGSRSGPRGGGGSPRS